MRNKLPITSHHLTVCEANYLRLLRLLANFKKDKYSFEAVINKLDSHYISFLVLERTKHTLIIEAKQNNKNTQLNNFTLRLNIFMDAKMAEVSSYQSEKPLPFFYKKSAIQSKDEKNQQNRFLTEWLESIFVSGLAPIALIENLFDE